MTSLSSLRIAATSALLECAAITAYADTPKAPRTAQPSQTGTRLLAQLVNLPSECPSQLVGGD